MSENFEELERDLNAAIESLRVQLEILENQIAELESRINDSVAHLENLKIGI